MVANPSFDPSHALFFAPFIVAIALMGIAVAVLPYWFIFKKAGFSPWLALLMAVPLVNLVVLYVIAFSQWRVVPVSYGYPPPRVDPGYPPAV